MARKVSKALLSPFLTKIHPDVLSSAPLDIRISNSSTLRSLNHYFDEIQHGNPTPPQSLHFYLPQGDHYRPIQYKLPSFSGGSEVAYRELHLKVVIKGLVEACKDTQEELGISDDIASVDAERAFYETVVVKQAAESVRKEKRREIRRKIEENVEQRQEEIGHIGSKFDPVIQSIISKSLRETLSSRLESLQIPSDFLYFSPNLTSSQVNSALLWLSEGIYLETGGPEVVLEMLKEMFGGRNPVPLYIYDRYSVSAMPGYFQIPWDGKVGEMVEVYREKKGEIEGRLRDFERYAREVGKMTGRLVRDKVVAAVTQGRLYRPSDESYTSISYQSSLELLTRIESFFPPNDLLSTQHIIISPVAHRINPTTLEIPYTASKSAIEALLRS